MKINRIDSDKTLDRNADRVEMEIDGIRYTITEAFGRMAIHVHGNKLDVMPGCANTITVKGYDE